VRKRPWRLPDPQPLASPLRWVTAGALIVAAAAHLPVIPEHLQEATYMGVAFVVFTYASLATAAVLLTADTRAVYLSAAVLGTAAVLTYAASRIVPLPLLADDVGNWAEPLGILAVAAEALAVLSAVGAWRTPRQANTVPSPQGNPVPGADAES